MLNRYYEQELANLRNLAAEFGRRNPALAPLLGSGGATDPDVERLLEGVAFMTGLVQQRLDDEFPEFIQSLAQLLFPHFLRPLPCMTIMQYTPRAVTGEAILVPAGTQFGSVPIDGERALFQAAFPVRIEPITIQSVRWEGTATESRSLVMELAFQGITASQWQGDRLRFWLGGSLNDATRLYRLLMRHVREVRVSAEGQPLVSLPANVIEASGQRADLNLLPWPVGAHPAWRVLYEYFALPQKLLFLDVTGLERWRTRGQASTMRLRFVFDELPDWTPEVDASSFVMHATPAVNLYPQDAHPLRIDNRQPEYRVQATANGRRNAQVFSIEHVSTRQGNGGETVLQPFSAFAQDQPAYQIRIRPAALHGGYDHFLSMPYAPGRPPVEQTLSVQLTCCDGALPDSLRLGDIREPTDTSPVRVGFSNITGVTPHRPPFIEGDLLWRVLSHLNANHLTLANRDHLRELLALHLPPRQGEGHADAAAHRRIASIETVEVTPERRVVRGMPVEGSVIRVECRGDHFPGPGALFLFGTVLDEFFAGCAAINTFTALTLHDTVHGETLTWPAKIGQQRLL